MTSTRTELLTLAEGVADGSIRRGLANEIVPLTAHPACASALEVFDALVEAVAAGVDVETGRLLDMLTQRQRVA